jgi:hypothetical protein
MTTVIVDRNDHSTFRTRTTTVYSPRRRASLRPSDDLDSLFCGVTDIEVDEEYLYRATTVAGF